LLLLPTKQAASHHFPTVFDCMKAPTRQTYAEIQKAYDFYNRELFARTLPLCLITYQREGRTLGYYSSNRWENDAGNMTDEIAMNPAFFGENSVPEILATLVHEMTHHWQHHFGTSGRGRYHNLEWANKMESIGLMPSSTGKPGGRRTGDQMSDYIIEDGPFDTSTNKLLKSDFTLTWKDTHTATATRHARKKPNRSNRQKYTCPECGFNAWARPRASLVCGDCMISMTFCK